MGQRPYDPVGDILVAHGLLGAQEPLQIDGANREAVEVNRLGVRCAAAVRLSCGKAACLVKFPRLENGMKRKVSLARTGFALTFDDAPPKVGARRVPPRQRNARMDAVVKHVHTSEKYSFAGACKAVGTAIKRARAKA